MSRSSVPDAVLRSLHPLDGHITSPKREHLSATLAD